MHLVLNCNLLINWVGYRGRRKSVESLTIQPDELKINKNINAHAHMQMG